VTLTVGEFPELQGEMGAYYARLDGEPGAVADAIGEHYQPKGAADEVAPSPMGAVVAIADRVDTLVGCLAVGLRPTGSEDPFGLRRLAGGVVRTLLQHRVRLSTSELVGAASGRLRGMENGKMLAAAAGREDDPRGPGRDGGGLLRRAPARGARRALRPRPGERRAWPRARTTRSTWLERVEALSTFWKTPAAADLAVAFKRVFNISREAPAGELTGRGPRAPHAARGGGPASRPSRTPARSSSPLSRGAEVRRGAGAHRALLRAPVDRSSTRSS
jgi:glycyl-tRNA synthetase beta chain